MAICVFPLMHRLRKKWAFEIIDAHFAYPAGYAAVLLGKWLELPVCVTLRGTESVQLRVPRLRRRVVAAAINANKVFSVSDALRKLLIEQGVAPDKIEVIGNGVDLTKFYPLGRQDARRVLGLPEDAKIL